MVAIGRALMANPDLILFDEISLGLAPVVIKTIYEALPGIISQGMSALIVEQDITRALEVSSRVYCLQEGRVSLEGDPKTISRGRYRPRLFRGDGLVDWVNAVVQGTLLGGLYALFAAGLSLIFGVMRLVNIAHGDLIVLAAYLGLSTTVMLGIHPFLALLIVMPVMAGIGYVLQRGILNRTLGDDILPPLLVTFGLSVIIQNALLEAYSADPQKLNAGVLETASVGAAGLAVGVLPLLTFGIAVLVIAGLQWVFLSDGAWPRLSRRVRQSGHCPAYGPEQRPHLWSGDGAGAGRDRDCGDIAWGAHQL